MADVSVIAYSCISALGHDVETSLESIFSGRVAVAEPKCFSTSHATKYPVFEIPDRDAFEWDKKELNFTALLTIRAVESALASSGLSLDYLKGKRIGVCIGTTVGNSLHNEKFYKEYSRNERPTMYEVKRYFSSTPANVVADRLSCNGPIINISNACSSGADAIGIGASFIKSGRCDIVIAGGADELTRISYCGFSALMINDSEHCRPFDISRKGLNLGEGAAICILEDSEKTIAPSLGNVVGYGTACDAWHPTAPHPEGKGLEEAISMALRDANIAKSDLAFINAHGTGTQDNDRVESKVFGRVLEGTPYFSTKGFTGHTLGAAGAIEAVLTLAMLRRGEIPASMGFTTPEEDALSTPTIKKQKIKSKVALSDSVAFGGNNTALILSV
ncbi:MAG: beta-ketoacyl-[acyl-carrier-protein] synthase family protein [Desulfotalea sp.]